MAPQTNPPARPAVLPAVVVLTGAAVCMTPLMNSGLALLAGIVVAQLGLNPWTSRTASTAKKMLALSVVGLGAGLDARAMANVGATGAALAVGSILVCLAAGAGLAKLLRVDPITGLLVAAGTAICGGSAIAAVGPTVRAREHQLAAALGTVFLLNAVALFVFPAVGEALGLDARSFGLWCALAIHDTSSVVGAAVTHGPDALEIATTVKLSRALWIIPLTAALAWRTRRRRIEASAGDVQLPIARPWFILGFVLVAAAVNLFPELRMAGELVSSVSRRLLVVTLFLVGASLDRQTFRRMGVRPLLQGVALWCFVSVATLAVILRVA